MLIYTLQRIGLALLICVTSMCLLFGAIRMIPGDMATIMLGAFLYAESKSAEPMIPLDLFRNPVIGVCSICVFLLGIGMYASIALVPALVELPRATGVGFGGSVTAAGLFMLPTAAPQLIVGPLTGQIARRIGSRAQLLIGVTLMRRVELVGTVVLVMVVELLNTAIEKLADRLTTDHDPQIGRVKDLGSAAVGVALIMAGLFWLFALAERMGAI